jgi:uncharacterized protein with HEPN domain
MSKRDDVLLFEDMLEAAQKIKRYTKDIDYEIVWSIIESYLDELITWLQKVLAEL